MIARTTAVVILVLAAIIIRVAQIIVAMVYQRNPLHEKCRTGFLAGSFWKLRGVAFGNFALALITGLRFRV